MALVPFLKTYLMSGPIEDNWILVSALHSFLKRNYTVHLGNGESKA